MSDLVCVECSAEVRRLASGEGETIVTADTPGLRHVNVLEDGKKLTTVAAIEVGETESTIFEIMFEGTPFCSCGAFTGYAGRIRKGRFLLTFKHDDRILTMDEVASFKRMDGEEFL